MINRILHSWSYIMEFNIDRTKSCPLRTGRPPWSLIFSAKSLVNPHLWVRVSLGSQVRQAKFCLRVVEWLFSGISCFRPILGQRKYMCVLGFRPYLGFCLNPKHFIVNCEQNVVVVVCSGFTSLSTIFQSYHDGVWFRQGAQCSLL